MTKSTGKRRSADETRTALLDAAEKRMVRDGPAALRLQDVASDVGISHPGVLHHFGSREGLVDGVISRAIAGLEMDLVKALKAQGSGGDNATMFDRVFDALFTRGHGRLIAWLALSGIDPFGTDAAREAWSNIAKTTHETRLAQLPKGSKKPSLEDTQFAIVLSALALLGHSVAGKPTFAAAGIGQSAAAEKRFRKWLTTVLTKHLASDGAE
ncbi:MAG: TetR/AcrR family transcriptional regulator [Polyangiaceae bacterium]